MELGSGEARARFGAGSVARLGTADARGVPHVVPVTFVVSGDMVFFAVDHKPKRTWDLRRLRNVRENPRV
ncbi:pyridoxamine 5'-phosphate oxidase family protein, partial [Streptomyces odonnellii]|uniref:pyridoxamine 5'-phosphate oxidase family protein n=1 Tax=Streptomyces odonnellii TaxID=1417980 RepID=UPI0006267C39